MRYLRMNEITEDGIDLHFDHKEGELNQLLEDLISTSPYSFDVYVRALNKHHMMTGKFSAEKTEMCSRCGDDFKLTLSGSINELLMPELDEPRNSHYTKPNHYSEFNLEDSGPSITSFSGNEFDLGEFLHEIIASTPPFNPICPECVQKNEAIAYDEEIPHKNSPFDRLKNLKIHN